MKGPKNKQLIARVSANVSSPALIVMRYINSPILFYLVIPFFILNRII